jgi:hypothetical protein
MKKKTSRIAMPDLQPQRGFPAAYREILFSFRKNTFGGSASPAAESFPYIFPSYGKYRKVVHGKSISQYSTFFSFRRTYEKRCLSVSGCKTSRNILFEYFPCNRIELAILYRKIGKNRKIRLDKKLYHRYIKTKLLILKG